MNLLQYVPLILCCVCALGAHLTIREPDISNERATYRETKEVYTYSGCEKRRKID